MVRSAPARATSTGSFGRSVANVVASTSTAATGDCGLSERLRRLQRAGSLGQRFDLRSYVGRLAASTIVGVAGCTLESDRQATALFGSLVPGSGGTPGLTKVVERLRHAAHERSAGRRARSAPPRPRCPLPTPSRRTLSRRRRRSPSGAFSQRRCSSLRAAPVPGALGGHVATT